MKKLILILLISTPCFASKSTKFDDPLLNQEFDNNYHEHSYPNWVNAKGSSATITYVNASSITVIQINAASGTVNSFMVVGTATNDNAPAGRIGEYVESVVTSMNLTRGSFVNFTSISLTPGDWDVTLNLGLIRNSSTWTDSEWGISTTSADSGMGVSCRGDYIPLNYGASDINAISVVIPACRLTLSASGTAYAPVIVNAGAGTPQARGRLSARRVR